ncbi:MAG: hypothetical protein IPJ74_26395, partial [Saprospiraceae bacterium]|nr:hypothetical protein [Saprospiraceae bacterium]
VIIKATGYFTTDDAHTLQMRVDLGGTTIGDASGITLPDLATGNEHWELEFVFTIRTTGVSGTAIGQGKFRFCEAIGGATNPCVESEMLNTSTFTVDTTIANALDVTAQWGTASSTSSITCTNLVIKAEN